MKNRKHQPDPGPRKGVEQNITDEEIAECALMELLGYNCRCGFCNGARGLSYFDRNGFVFLHPSDFARMEDCRGRIFFDWSAIAPPRFCVGCQARFNDLKDRRTAEYSRRFPNGPEPILTFDPNDPQELEIAKRAIHASVIEAAYADGGGGLSALEAGCRLAQAAINKLHELNLDL